MSQPGDTAGDEQLRPVQEEEVDPRRRRRRKPRKLNYGGPRGGRPEQKERNMRQHTFPSEIGVHIA